MHAAWTFYEDAKAQQDPADPRLRGLSGVRLAPAARSRAGARALQPPGPAGPESHRLPEPGPAHLDRLHRGVLPPAPDRQGGARGSTPRGSSAWRPASRARWRCTSARAGTRRRKKSAEWFAGPSARTASGSRSSSTGSRRSGWSPRGCSGWARSSASASWPPTTRTTSGGRTPRRTTCCSPSAPAATSTIPSGSASPGEESYVKSEKEMRALFPDHPETLANTARVADLCEFDFEKRYFLPELPPPRRIRHRRGAARPPGHARGAERRYGTPLPPRGRRAAGLRARRHQHGGLRRLLPHRAGFHRRRPGAGHSGGPGPRLGGRLDRGLRARDHQRLPAQVRPPVRAVPQPRAGVDAGHRRGLLLRAPGRGDRVRPRALRPRQRRARSSPSAP